MGAKKNRDVMYKCVFIYYSKKLFAIALFKEHEDVVATVQLLKSSDRPEGLTLL